MRSLLLAALLLVAFACSPTSPAPAASDSAKATSDKPAPAAQAPATPAVQAPSNSAKATSDKAAPAPAPAAPRVETATFAVPDLDAMVATNIAAALAAVPGLKTARPRIADKRFEVDFTPPTATPDALLAVLKGVSAATTLEGVKPIDGSPAPEGGCGSCPMKDSCGGHDPATH
jgi:hypothetical protein